MNPRKHPWGRDGALFEAWKEGRTGYPLVVRASPLDGMFGGLAGVVVLSSLTDPPPIHPPIINDNNEQDANMRELAATGFMSNRGRQIVASFLTRDLGLDWRMGAAHFEELLLDYDPCSNYGNWCYAAGGCVHGDGVGRGRSWRLFADPSVN